MYGIIRTKVQCFTKKQNGSTIATDFLYVLAIIWVPLKSRAFERIVSKLVAFGKTIVGWKRRNKSLCFTSRPSHLLVFPSRKILCNSWALIPRGILYTPKNVPKYPICFASISVSLWNSSALIPHGILYPPKKYTNYPICFASISVSHRNSGHSSARGILYPPKNTPNIRSHFYFRLSLLKLARDFINIQKNTTIRCAWSLTETLGTHQLAVFYIHPKKTCPNTRSHLILFPPLSLLKLPSAHQRVVPLTHDNRFASRHGAVRHIRSLRVAQGDLVGVALARRGVNEQCGRVALVGRGRDHVGLLLLCGDRRREGLLGILCLVVVCAYQRAELSRSLRRCLSHWHRHAKGRCVGHNNGRRSMWRRGRLVPV